jgi:biopolymer transport protein ExbD
MALGKSRRRSKAFVPPKLQITAMMDMFTIVLIFLLFSFSSEPDKLVLDKELELPKSIAKMSYKETIKLVLSQNSLKLEDRVVAKLNHGKIIGLNRNKLKDSYLYKELSTYWKEKERVKAVETAEKQILFLCDKRLPFKTINSIVKTAALAGFPNFQFAVLKK